MLTNHATITTMTPRTTQPVVDISCSLMTSFPERAECGDCLRPRAKQCRMIAARPPKIAPFARFFERLRLTEARHAVAPSPRFAPPIGVGIAPRRDICHNASVRAQFRRDGAFGDFWRREYAGVNRLRLAPRQHDVGELLVFERHLGALDVQVIARPRQPLREMTPVRRA